MSAPTDKEILDNICAQFAAGEISREEAIAMLAHHNLDSLEARSLLDASAT